MHSDLRVVTLFRSCSARITCSILNEPKHSRVASSFITSGIVFSDVVIGTGVAIFALSSFPPTQRFGLIALAGTTIDILANLFASAPEWCSTHARAERFAASTGCGIDAAIVFLPPLKKRTLKRLSAFMTMQRY